MVAGSRGSTAAASRGARWQRGRGAPRPASRGSMAAASRGSTAAASRGSAAAIQRERRGCDAGMGARHFILIFSMQVPGVHLGFPSKPKGNPPSNYPYESFPTKFSMKMLSVGLFDYFPKILAPGKFR
jgi:hypothetical protein